MFAADSKELPASQRATSRPAPTLGWSDIIGPIEPFLKKVNQRLAQQVKSFDPQIIPYAEYALGGEGKHLRPTLVGLAAQTMGQIEDSHTKVAVVIEMVHLATLIHDDIMDEAEIRRGQLTVASQWGNDIAVLFGDCLFARALVLAAEFPTPEICRAVAAATNTVCSGEILQTRQKSDFKMTQTEYFKILEMKTAELFALSCELGTFLSSASVEHRQAMRQFGLQFGTAYQIYDDCVDLFGTEAAAGKSLGTDLAKGKLTLPLLLAWERADQADRGRLQELVRNWRPDSMGAVSELLARYDTLPGSLVVLGRYIDTARQALERLPASKGRAGLHGLTEILAAQTESLGSVLESSP